MEGSSTVSSERIPISTSTDQNKTAFGVRRSLKLDMKVHLKEKEAQNVEYVSSKKTKRLIVVLLQYPLDIEIRSSCAH